MKAYTVSFWRFSIGIGNPVHRRTIFAITCIAIVVILGAITALSVVSKSVSYANSVRGSGAEIYWDQSCTNRTLTFNWGSIERGSNTAVTVYVKNEGGSATYLSLTTSNWTPSSASAFITLVWNYSGQILNNDQVIPLKLTLSVFATTTEITHFSFDTTISTTS
jgi:hypothetical protein